VINDKSFVFKKVFEAVRQVNDGEDALGDEIALLMSGVR